MVPGTSPPARPKAPMVHPKGQETLIKLVEFSHLQEQHGQLWRPGAAPTYVGVEEIFRNLLEEMFTGFRCEKIT